MFKGSNVALITPFKNNKLDVDAYIKLIHFHIENGTNGLVPAGTTGESPTLSHDEHQKVIDLCVQESKGKIPVIAGTGLCLQLLGFCLLTLVHKDQLLFDVHHDLRLVTRQLCLQELVHLYHFLYENVSTLYMHQHPIYYF